MELISLHVPKCAGTSLREALQKAYGKAAVFLDYNDHLLNPDSPVNQNTAAFLQTFSGERDALLRGKKVAHGHFWIKKYEGIDALRVTLLRHPVDRLVSHYFFWKAQPKNEQLPRNRFMAPLPSIAEFARLPEFRHFYSRVFFRDVDMDMFDFIGSFEKLDASLTHIEKLTGRTLTLKERNATDQPEIDAALRTQLHDILKEDIAFYERYAR